MTITHPRKQTLILTQTKTDLNLKGYDLQIQRPHQYPETIPIPQLDRLVLIGSIPLTRLLQKQLQRHHIALLQLDTQGEFLGAWHPSHPHRQTPTPPSSDRAEPLLRTYLHNALQTLTQLNTILPTPQTTHTQHLLTLIHDDLIGGTPHTILRDYCSSTSNHYDQTLRHWLTLYTAQLNGSRPIIPINTALRLSEALLYDDIDRAIAKAGLWSDRGYLHDQTDCPAPLTCDGVLLLRCTWVDQLVARWLVHWAMRDTLTTFLNHWLTLTDTPTYQQAIAKTINQLREGWMTNTTGF